MVPSWQLCLRDEVTVAPSGDGELVLSCPWLRLPWRRLGPGAFDAARRLAPPGETEGRLAASVLDAEGPAGLARWYARLQQLARAGLLTASVRADGRPLATLVPSAPAFAFSFARPAPHVAHVLSRFAYVRSENGALLLESPRSFARLVLHDARVAALLPVLARPARPEDWPGLPAEAVGPLLGLLVEAGVVRQASADGTTDEENDPALKTWEFHDLLFHARAREGRHDAPVGAVFPWAGKLPPPPALKPVPAGESVELYRPDLEELARRDLPFLEVQERRRSVREYGPEPLAERELAEFLYRVARVKEEHELEVLTSVGPLAVPFASRPYPGGGGLYELEVYPVVNACRGLASGLYYYDPRGHRLVRLAGRTPEVERLLADAAGATGMAPERAQVLLVLAARFQRLAWKYASLAYALTLKHVGVVYQTMYLTATAMGLAPCAVGVGNSDVFSQAAGTDYYAETSVGEFLLGSRPGEGPR